MPRKEIPVHAPATPIDLDGDVDAAMTAQTEAQLCYVAPETWLSVRQAAEYTGKKKMQITKAITSGKLTARTREVHPDYPPLTEISKADLNIWNAPKAPKAAKQTHAGARATRGGQDRRWLLYVPDSQIEYVKEALKPFGVEPTTAYRSKKDRAADKVEPNADTQTANADQDAILDALRNNPPTPIDGFTPVENDASAPASTSDELELVEA